MESQVTDPLQVEMRLVLEPPVKRPSGRRQETTEGVLVVFYFLVREPVDGGEVAGVAVPADLFRSQLLEPITPQGLPASWPDFTDPRRVPF